MYRKIFCVTLILALAIVGISVSLAQDEPPPAEFVNDDGGVVSVIGTFNYSDPSVPDYGSQPIIFLGDISNIFVEGGFDFSTEYLNLDSPQVMASLTSDIHEGPLTYTVKLPIDPGGILTDVDNDEEAEPGVMVYTVNFTFNGIGDVFIDDREFIYFSSVKSSQDFETLYQLNGGKVLVYAEADGQGFPSGFGDDGKIFTEDDPIVTLPSGYTMVDIETDLFTFDRSEEVVMDIVESEGAEFRDFSELSYAEAFDEMIDMMRKEYAFTTLKGVDWDAKIEEFRPRFVEADENEDQVAYERALQDFMWSIPDGHIGMPFTDSLFNQFLEETDGGLGMAIRDIDDGRVITNFILDGGPAAEAGIELGAEIVELNGEPINRVITANVPWSSPFSSKHVLRLQQLRYAIRFSVDTAVEVTFQNPDSDEPETVTLTTVAERQSFSFSSFASGLSGFELPVEFRQLDNGYGYIKLYSFSDDNLLTLALWERAITQFNNAGVEGIIIDMRQNGGGSPDIGNVMLGYLVDEELYTGTSAFYFPDLDAFEFNSLYDQVIYPSSEVTQYHGKLAVLVGPSCASMCEFFSYTLTLNDRAAIVGQYPTAGLGGGINQFAMPEGIIAQFTVGRAVGADNEIHIEGTGVVPDVLVPVDEDTLFTDEDVILDAAVEWLDEATSVNAVDGDPIAVGESVTGSLEVGQRVNHVFNSGDGGVVNIVMDSEAGAFVIILDPDGNILADGTSADDPGWEELELPPNFDLVLQVMMADDAGEGEYTLSIESIE
jgi:C-terminal processing protease CtpA/Prc